MYTLYLIHNSMNIILNVLNDMKKKIQIHEISPHIYGVKDILFLFITKIKTTLLSI